MSPAVPKMRATPRGGGADMSPSHGRPKTGDTPRGGVARSAGVRT